MLDPTQAKGLLVAADAVAVFTLEVVAAERMALVCVPDAETTLAVLATFGTPAVPEVISSTLLVVELKFV